jgi:DNA-binding GntR family transcriptional regulator
MEQIGIGGYAPEAPLLPENLLAKNYKVSRATIHSAFDRLEAMGLIIRRQRIGTYVRKSSDISNLLNQFIDFPRLIASHVFTPGHMQSHTELIESTPQKVQSFELSIGDRMLEIEKIFREFTVQKCGLSIAYYISAVRADIQKNWSIPRVNKQLGSLLPR